MKVNDPFFYLAIGLATCVLLMLILKQAGIS